MVPLRNKRIVQFRAENGFERSCNASILSETGANFRIVRHWGWVSVELQQQQLVDAWTPNILSLFRDPWSTARRWPCVGWWCWWWWWWGWGWVHCSDDHWPPRGTTNSISALTDARVCVNNLPRNLMTLGCWPRSTLPSLAMTTLQRRVRLLRHFRLIAH